MTKESHLRMMVNELNNNNRVHKKSHIFNCSVPEIDGDEVLVDVIDDDW